jgi:hypothetical protein
MLLLAFLLLELSLLDLQDALVGLPPLLPVEDEVALGVETVGHLRERVIPAVTAESHLLVENTVLLPAEVAFIDEPANTADLAAVQGEQFDAHLHRHVLEGEIGTDEPHVEPLLLLLLLLEVGHHLRHLLLVVLACDPPLLVVRLARRR